VRSSASSKKRRRLPQTLSTAKVLSGAVRSEINVTPLVDVVLVLLIIFMVVTPMLSRGVKLDLPTAQAPEKKQDTGEQIIVSITKDKRLYIDTEPVDDDKLITAVKIALFKKKPDGSMRDVHVKGDRELSYGDVRKVLERLHEAGAAQIALGAEELKLSMGEAR
jgi:biopolymer transport protein ExbD/biopolymer transport protein TolR